MKRFCGLSVVMSALGALALAISMATAQQCCPPGQPSQVYREFQGRLVPVEQAVADLKFAVAQGEPAKLPVEPVKLKHGRGHKTPHHLKALRRMSWTINGDWISKLDKKDLPATYDLVALGKVGPIKDQAQCGSCWDFSGCGVCECAYFFAGLAPPDGTFQFSEQEVLDCGAADGFKNGGCDGDDNTTVLSQAKQVGLVLTSDYGPYTGAAGQCKSTSAMKRYKITDWGYCGDQNGVCDTATAKAIIIAKGAIGCAVAASGGDWDNYTGGVDTPSGSTDIDHDVMIVGWDDAKAWKRKNRVTAEVQAGTGCWKVRNSWGTNWGEKGYMWLPYGGDQIGTEAVWASAGTAPTTVPAITSVATATGTVGTPFTYQIVANTATSFAATGLPSGLTVNVTTGVISGTPTAAAVSTVTLSATNASGTGTATLTLTVTGIGPTPPTPPTPGATPTFVAADGSTLVYFPPGSSPTLIDISKWSDEEKAIAGIIVEKHKKGKR